jgi:hypothetical protein
MEAVAAVAWSAVIGLSSRLSEEGCIERLGSIIGEKAEGLSGHA